MQNNMKNPIITLENVYKNFEIYNEKENKKEIFTVLSNVSLSVNHGDCIVLGGANGSGKSLLMTIIAQLEKPTSGSVWVHTQVGLIFQNSDIQILGETPWEDVAVGLKNQKIKKNDLENNITTSLQAVALAHKAFFPARNLSGGEKRRLATASILAINRDTIIFDEPYANLDYSGVVQVNELIINLQNQGKTIIILTHELEKCLALANRFIVLYKGTIVFNGTPEEGLQQDLKKWAIRHPLTTYTKLEDLLWK